jgi:hypothetical protein
MSYIIQYPNLEPLSTSHPDYDAIVKQTLSEYPRACICMIDRVVLPNLSEEFERRRLAFEQKGWGRVLRVYHGTAERNVNSIVTNGFDPRFARVQAFGAGIYFATTFRISYTYAGTDGAACESLSHMFICDILPGRYARGRSNQVPPAGIDSQGNGETIVITTHFAIPAANQMIPRYLVRFHKDSEQITDAADVLPPMPAAVRAKLAQPTKRSKNRRTE